MAVGVHRFHGLFGQKFLHILQSSGDRVEQRLGAVLRAAALGRERLERVLHRVEALVQPALGLAGPAMTVLHNAQHNSLSGERWSWSEVIELPPGVRLDRATARRDNFTTPGGTSLIYFVIQPQAPTEEAFLTY